MQYFWFGIVLENFIFKGLSVNSLAGFFGTLVIVGLMAFLLVVVSFSIELLSLVRTPPNKEIEETTHQLEDQVVLNTTSQKAFWFSDPCKLSVITTFLNLIKLILGYFLMLIVMSFNVYVLLSVTLGSILGYLLLNPILIAQHQSYSINRLLHCKPVRNSQEEECGALLLNTSNQEASGHISSTGTGNSNEKHDSNNIFSVTATVHT